MAILDVDRLLEPVSDDSPCGPNLEYDDTYAAFERAARGKAEQQYGETIIPAEPPDWAEVRRLGVELVERTKDLRVVCQLARGVLETDSLSDFAASLALVRGYIERVLADCPSATRSGRCKRSYATRQHGSITKQSGDDHSLAASRTDRRVARLRTLLASRPGSCDGRYPGRTQ